ncbi:MAG: type VI secretion system ATPase TssH, partial [bacterium]|nr:type VI secretion system ATPase TssH [bacterium]
RTVAATTWAEYKKYFEKDPALTRRFQVIQVDEPSEEKAILMMRGMASTMENHHRVQVIDEALEASVRLSHRYIPARQLPDKSVSLLDTACARVAVSQHAVPAEVDDSRRRIEALETEHEIINRETAVGVDTTAREERVNEQLEEEHVHLEVLDERWNSEKELVQQILDIRSQLRGQVGKVEGTESELEKAADSAAESVIVDSGASTEDAVEQAEELTHEQRDERLQTLRGLQQQLAELQGESPLILPSVDSQAIASVVADWTGIPVGRMVKNEAEAVLKLGDTLNE